MKASSVRLTPQQQQALTEAAQWYAEFTAEFNTGHTRQDWQSWILKQPENQWAWHQLELLKQRFNQLSGSCLLNHSKQLTMSRYQIPITFSKEFFSGI